MADDMIVFGPSSLPRLSPARRLAARSYVESALAMTAIEAINFQRSLLNSGEADDKLRNSVADSVLDRFMGKAAQELRIGETADRPIIFDAKLRTLKEGMEAALDAVARDESPQEAFEEAVTAHLVDTEGVSIG
jgi:hypothetical protein